MKKLVSISLFLSLVCTTSFGQVIQKKMTQSKTTVTAVPIVKQPLVAKPVIKPPVAQKISSQVVNGLQKAVVNIVVGDDGKDKDSKLSITIEADDGGVANHLCAYYGGASIEPISSGAYLPGENVTIPTNLYAGILYTTDNGNGTTTAGAREAVFSDFSSGGSIHLQFETTNDIWKIKSLTVSLFFDKDPFTPYKITWTNIQLSQDVLFKDLKFDKNFKPIQ